MQTRFALYAQDDPNFPFLGVFFLTPDPDWHVYGNEPGPTGMPTTVQARLEGLPLPVLYAPAALLPDPLDPTLYVPQYVGETPFFIPLATYPAEPLEIELQALLCSSTTCYPVQETFFFPVPDSEHVLPARSQSWWPLVSQAQAGRERSVPSFQAENASATHHASEELVLHEPGPALPVFAPRYFAPGLEVQTLSKAAGLAFLAGLILNFMPCVLPVITLKLRSFIPVVDRVSTAQRQSFRTHNLFFALGMMVYFLVLACIIAATGMAWGQIFQQPAAILILTAVVFALGLSLFGIYDLPLIDLKSRSSGMPHHPRTESFVTGILATILATPCSGPFLGGVLAWALVQPPQIIAVVLSCIGLGMASPYVLMAGFPGLYALLPRAGAWTIQVERFLGFLLMGTCVYLLGLLPPGMYLDVLILLWTISLAAWIWGQWTSLAQSRLRRWTLRSTGLLLVAVAALFLFRPQSAGETWRPFDAPVFAQMLGEKNIVLEFTADWCPNCKFLEKTVLDPKKSAALAQDFDLKLFRVDLTQHDPKLMALLESLGSKSIPVLAIFPHDRPDSPLVIRDLFTSAQLREALNAELGPRSRN
ncbi:hypothetical protein MASR1M90_10070 [Desulfovibrionales bacterium]